MLMQMPQTVVYNVSHEEAMGVLVVVYFFLSGLSAGVFLTAASCRIFGKEAYAKIEKTAAIAAPILLGPGLLCLLLDLNKPLRFFNLIFNFNPSSVASWGVWLISIFMGLSVLYAFLHVIGKAARATPLAYIGSALAIAVGLYSGMLLYQMRAYALWHSALVPPIFLASAIASGLAVVLLLSWSADPAKTRVLGRALAIVVGVDLVLALTEVLTLVWSHGAKAEVGKVVLSGNYGFLFIAVYLVLGLALPLAVLVGPRSGRRARAVSAVLVVVGTLAMRYVIVIGGQALPLS